MLLDLPFKHPARIGPSLERRVSMELDERFRELADRFCQTPASHQHIAASCGFGAKLFMAASKAGKFQALSSFAWPDFDIPPWREVDI